MTWIHTYSGRRFDLLDPKPDQVALVDVVHALSHIRRFTGHCRWGGMTVAQHSLGVERLVSLSGGADLRARRAALFHDAHEAYVGDRSYPLKEAVRLVHESHHPTGNAGADDIEDRAQAVVRRRFEAECPAAKAVIKRADLQMLAYEAWHFLPGIRREDLRARWSIDASLWDWARSEEAHDALGSAGLVVDSARPMEPHLAALRFHALARQLGTPP